MFLLRKPSRAEIDRFLDSQSSSNFSYRDVGLSLTGHSPEGYYVDHAREYLGDGEQTWLQATSAIKTWKMFDFSWLQLCWPDSPLKPGTNVAALVQHLGFWSINACRIVAIIDEKLPVRRYGFVYGTLEDHTQSGEERFLVEWDDRNNAVSYDVFAFSRPKALLARVGLPLSRMLQRRFARYSKQAMREHCSGSH